MDVLEVKPSWGVYLRGQGALELSQSQAEPDTWYYCDLGRVTSCASVSSSVK